MKYRKHNPDPPKIHESHMQIITPRLYFKLLEGQFKNCSFSFHKNMYSNKSQRPIHVDTKSKNAENS